MNIDEKIKALQQAGWISNGHWRHPDIHKMLAQLGFPVYVEADIETRRPLTYYNYQFGTNEAYDIHIRTVGKAK